MGHVHALAVNPADDALYMGAHNGVFRLSADGMPQRVGRGEQDTMGLTVAGPNRFLASGHPAHDEGGPQHLGLLESTDAAVTWRGVSLAGDADFHVLRYRHDRAYGFNSVTGELLVSSDLMSWQTRAKLPVGDFAVSPSSPDVLLATTRNGLQRSTDGGITWVAAGGPPVALLQWERDDRLWGVTAAGDVLRSADGGAAWSAIGRLPAEPTAFIAHGDNLYAAVHDRGIAHSGDGGVTWTSPGT